MFLGSFKTIFSGKNRLILPKRFRKALGNGDKFYIFLGENGEVWGFDPKNWSRLSESILKFPLSTEEGRVGRLKVFPRAEECSLDGQGRFILPQEFIENLDFKNEVLIIGAGDHFEVWDAHLWHEHYERISRKRSSY
ncbi:MAG: hypothetical protein Q7R77_01080 [Candidatus Daviesbacteria bacterium]|nr:hypothetical protein [Candidatus Daviesbacteria bacterium]